MYPLLQCQYILITIYKNISTAKVTITENWSEAGVGCIKYQQSNTKPLIQHKIHCAAGLFVCVVTCVVYTTAIVPRK